MAHQAALIGRSHLPQADIGLDEATDSGRTHLSRMSRPHRVKLVAPGLRWGRVPHWHMGCDQIVFGLGGGTEIIKSHPWNAP